MITIDGRTLRLEDVGLVARDPSVGLGLDEGARAAVERSRSFLEALLAKGERVYGVTTGFGRLADVVVSADEQATLQRNLVRSHSAGVGRPLDRASVRAIMLLRANALARGNSGCRPEVITAILDLLNAGIHPVVPDAGSVGASGDLAPLAHVALSLMGEGEVEYRGRIVETDAAFRDAGLAGLDLREKEGLALINGTQATTGLGVLALLAAERALESAEVAGAMSLDGLRGTPEAFRPEVQEARPHPGQGRSARRLTELIEGSQIRESHRHGDTRLQDAYALRCMPQVHGAARDTLAHVRRVLEIEANSATDNPLVFADAEVVVSAGNFHAQVVAQALDYLAIAITDLASISERRVERLLNPDLSGLPPFLASRPGLESGLMIAQVAAVDLLAEMRVLSHPASVDSVPTSANREDHVSMGLAAARKARRCVGCLESIVAIELICAARALDLLRPLESSAALELAHARLRAVVPPFEEDRVWARDIEAATELIRSGAIESV